MTGAGPRRRGVGASEPIRAASFALTEEGPLRSNEVSPPGLSLSEAALGSLLCRYWSVRMGWPASRVLQTLAHLGPGRKLLGAFPGGVRPSCDSEDSCPAPAPLDGCVCFGQVCARAGVCARVSASGRGEVCLRTTSPFSARAAGFRGLCGARATASVHVCARQSLPGSAHCGGRARTSAPVLRVGRGVSLSTLHCGARGSRPPLTGSRRFTAQQVAPEAASRRPAREKPSPQIFPRGGWETEKLRAEVAGPKEGSGAG